MKPKLLSIFILSIVVCCWGNISASELSFEVTPSTQILHVGDTLTLTMTVLVTGNPENYDAEPLSKLELPGFSTIATSPRHRKGTRDSLAFEERITTFKLVAEEEGSYTIPSFVIPYTDFSSQDEGELVSSEVELTVLQSMDSISAQNGIYIVLVFILVVLLSVGGFFIWLRHVKSRRFAEDEKHNIDEKFASWINELSRHLTSGAKDTFTEQAYNFINEFIEDNYHLGLKGRKFEKRIELIEQKQVDQALVELLRQAYQHLEEMKFGGIVRSSEELQALLHRIREIKQDFNSRVKPSHTGE